MCLLNGKFTRIFLNRRVKTYSTKNSKTTSEITGKPFEEIPGPLSLPIIGTLYLYLPFIGRYSINRLHRNALKNYNLYGPIIREEIAPGRNIVWLADPEDIAKVFHSETQYPFRTSHLALQKYRLDRPHIYNSGGLLPTNGAEWARIRKAFQKGLSSPADALTFIKGSDQIISEWMNVRLEKIGKKDFIPELSRLFLELVGFAAFDTRFQSFYEQEIHPYSRSAQLISSAFIANSNIPKADSGPQLWRKFPTPTYIRLRNALEYMESVAVDLVALKMTTFKEEIADPTLLERYIANPTVDFKDIIGIVCDFLLAGMDTTSYTSSFLLYHLATNPDAQEKLYEEVKLLLPNRSDPITIDIYKKALYTKCVLKESLRLRPVAIGIGRTLSSELILSGYKIPAGTVIVTLNQILSRFEQYFPEADKFKPERWVRSDPSYRKVHPYVVIPFGHGQRTCIARRFAEENMCVLIMKIIRNYKISWRGSSSIDSKSFLINKPDSPILLNLEKRF